MPDGRFLQYYWHIRTQLNQKIHLLDPEHLAYEICQDYEIEYTGVFRASIVFKNGSRLIARFSLRADEDVEEYNYAYVYLNAKGERVFQYDDAPHHPELSSHPHHVHKGARPAKGPDEALPLDVPDVDFVTILDKIIHEHLR